MYRKPISPGIARYPPKSPLSPRWTHERATRTQISTALHRRLFPKPDRSCTVDSRAEEIRERQTTRLYELIANGPSDTTQRMCHHRSPSMHPIPSPPAIPPHLLQDKHGGHTGVTPVHAPPHGPHPVTPERLWSHVTAPFLFRLTTAKSTRHITPTATTNNCSKPRTSRHSHHVTAVKRKL